MGTTKTWAESLSIATAADLAPVADYSKPYTRTAEQVAIRAVILQGVVAVACQVDSHPIVEWFQAQAIWNDVTPQERTSLENSRRTEAERVQFQWMMQHVMLNRALSAKESGVASPIPK